MGLSQESLAGGTPQLPNVQGFDPLQTQAQSGVVNKASGALQDQSAELGSANSFLLTGARDVKNNPYLAGAMDAAIRPLTESFQSVVMPGVRAGQIQAGALGSPKGNMQGQQAATNYMRQVADTTAQMGNEAYKTGVDATTKGVALAPQTMQSMLFPETALEAVGSQRRALQQEQAQQGFNQTMLPWQLGLQLMGSSAALPGAGSTSTVNPAQPGTSWTNMLGAGMSLAAMLAGF